jgi:hypothetical protein
MMLPFSSRMLEYASLTETNLSIIRTCHDTPITPLLTYFILISACTSTLALLRLFHSFILLAYILLCDVHLFVLCFSATHCPLLFHPQLYQVHPFGITLWFSSLGSRCAFMLGFHQLAGWSASATMSLQGSPEYLRYHHTDPLVLQHCIMPQSKVCFCIVLEITYKLKKLQNNWFITKVADNTKVLAPGDLKLSCPRRLDFASSIPQRSEMPFFLFLTLKRRPHSGFAAPFPKVSYPLKCAFLTPAPPSRRWNLGANCYDDYRDDYIQLPAVGHLPLRWMVMRMH